MLISSKNRIFERHWLLSACIAITIGVAASFASSEKNLPKDILILGLDGVSYQSVLKMYDGGYFRKFQRPIPMVASFPSISDPNWTHLLGAQLEKGYTKAHFEFTKNKDNSVGQEVGNLITHLTTPPHYEKSFDFKPEGPFQHLMSMTWAETSALFWTESLTRQILENNKFQKKGQKNIFKAFVLNTDFISHMSGEEQILQYLKQLDKNLQKLQTQYKEKFKKDLDIVIVTDHGNFYQKPKAVEFENFLAKKGFQHKSVLNKKTDYAFLAPEIISFASLYCLPDGEEDLAKNMVQVEGVHVSLIRSKENAALPLHGIHKIKVYAKNSEAEILVNSVQKTVSYIILTGKDPFDHIRFFKNKKNLSWDEYFNKTLETDYPNALVRAWEGFYKNAEVPGSVLISPKLGYVFTNWTLELLTAIKGVKSTHGSFHKQESFGFVMSTLPLTEEAISPFEFQNLIDKL